MQPPVQVLPEVHRRVEFAPGRDRDLPSEVEARIVGALAQVPFNMIQLTGIGAVTFRDDWVGLRRSADYVGVPH